MLHPTDSDDEDVTISKQTGIKSKPPSCSGSESVPSTSCNPILTTNFSTDWAYNFVIPLTKFPQKERTLNEKGCRPSPSRRREIVRIICSDISQISAKPGKKALAILIAQNIVKAYPTSFEDVIEGTRIGSGYDSLLKQLQLRIDNVNR